MLLRWILFFVFVGLIEIYSFQAIRTFTKWKWVRHLYQILSMMVWIYISFEFAQFDRRIGQNKQTLFTLGLLLIVFLPKLILAVFMFVEDVYRIIVGLLSFLFSKSENKGFLPGRRRFVSQVSLALAAIPFSSLLYGVTKGKYNFKVIRQTIYFPDLPEDFDGFTITQISDLHSGSFDDTEKINYAIDLINHQNSEMILFTGDIVNTHAKEMQPWIDSFKRIKTPEFGKYSVLGNHDYGEYIDWPSEDAKLQNFNAIKGLHDQIGFQLLLNENVKINKGKGEIFLVGVENWGKSFRKAGDINLASIGLTKEDFKVLMTHDPSHWEYEVKNHDKNFHLSLSGHTHGLQFGVEIPGLIKWSPVQYVYKQWAGLYENLGRYIYVNRGFGFHAYPGRVGIWPEITVLELKKGNFVA